MKAINLLLPFTPVRARWLKLMLIVQAGFAIALWAMSGSKTLPAPMEVAHTWVDLVQRQGPGLRLLELGDSQHGREHPDVSEQLRTEDQHQGNPDHDSYLGPENAHDAPDNHHTGHVNV